MARKFKTKSPKGRDKRTSAERAALDLCRIDTQRIRALSTDQLDRIKSRIGRSFLLPKKESGYGSFRWLLSSFVNDLTNVRTAAVTEHDVKYKLSYGGYREPTKDEIKSDLEHNIRMKDMYTEMANEKEAKIREMQERAGCKLRGEELVARDAEREGKHDVAAEVRRGARRPPTPHKRPAKIR